MNPVPSSANLSDALSRLGLKAQTLCSRIRSITGLPVCGPAYTVHCYPGATHAVEEALELARPGDVLVVNGEAYTEAVLLGGLMSTRASFRGLAGAVVDGAVRDIADLRKLRWPVFAAGVTPRSGTFDRLGAQQSAVACGGVVIHPGDLMVGDEDGLVCVPASRIEEALDLADRIARKESSIAKALRDGLTLGDAVRQCQQTPEAAEVPKLAELPELPGVV